MKQNEHNVFIDGFEDIEVGNSYQFGLSVRVGEHGGKWGYVISSHGKTSGNSSGLTPRDLMYSSRSEALKQAKKEAMNIQVVKEFPQKMFDELMEKLDNSQIDLFGEAGTS